MHGKQEADGDRTGDAGADRVREGKGRVQEGKGWVEEGTLGGGIWVMTLALL